MSLLKQQILTAIREDINGSYPMRDFTKTWSYVGQVSAQRKRYSYIMKTDGTGQLRQCDIPNGANESFKVTWKPNLRIVKEISGFIDNVTLKFD